MADNKLNDIIRTSLDCIKELVDVNTVIGTPITTASGATIIPVSKITVGFASGGVDYFGKTNNGSGTLPPQNFGGGGGTGLTVSPVGFLVISPEGKIELLNLASAANKPDAAETISNLLEKSPEIMDKIKTVFKKEKTE
ncbi:MAG: sporulation protein YtfJ [Oscillospiraceae bacterium]|nr:sporulation protein YtfJ [Oscillospiraceae bacterium]